VENGVVRGPFLKPVLGSQRCDESLHLSSATSVDGTSFCCEVTDYWFANQEAIGGVGIEDETDETLISRRRYGRGRMRKQIWLFGGIERVSKRRFVVPLTGSVGHKRNKETLIPLIKKYVKPESIICSDAWRAYNDLSQLGYKHYAVNHSKNFVDPGNPSIPTQNIERLWLDLKQWIKV